jgi:hypothetical protein
MLSLNQGSCSTIHNNTNPPRAHPSTGEGLSPPVGGGGIASCSLVSIIQAYVAPASLGEACPLLRGSKPKKKTASGRGPLSKHEQSSKQVTCLAWLGQVE